ncbi:MAG: hypothetical protein WAM04_04850 [Candidatus Sulfotelmatobacter sp.]
MANTIPAMIPGEFEEGLLSFPSVDEAIRDPLYVDSGFILDELSDHAPWTLSLLYGDGGALSIPLELMFNEPLKGPKLNVFRRHKSSGRIIPCQISLDDPGLRDNSLNSLSPEEAMRRLVPPRFDPVLTPSITATLNLEQNIFLTVGFLKVIRLQLFNPVLFGWAPGSVADGAGSIALRGLAPRAAVATVDATSLAARVGSEVSSLPVNPFLKFLEAARRISLAAVPPNVKADAIEAVAQRLGLEVGGRSVVAGGRILVVAKDARTAFQIAADGSVSFGKVVINGGKLDVVNPTAIRALKL